MSKMSKLAEELAELRHCGEVLISISETLTQMFSAGNSQGHNESPQEAPASNAKTGRLVMKCLNCEKEFAPMSANQIYCSAGCGRKYRRKHPERLNFPAVFFKCANCGMAVVTDGKHDKRTRFCSQECNRKYWRHPPKKA